MHNNLYSCSLLMSAFFLLISPLIAQMLRFAVSLSFCVVALLAARNSVAVDSSFCSLSFYVVALLAAHHSVVNCSCPSLSFHIVAELTFVKTYHYDFLSVIESEVICNYLYRDLYVQRSSYIICISACNCL